MFRPSWKSLLMGVVVAAILMTGASQADAWWARCYQPASWGCCYSPCYATYYTVSYDPCCYSGGGWYVGYRPGPVRRLLFGPYRWYYGGYSSYCCSYDVCCTAVETTGQPTPAVKSVPTPAKKPVTETPAAVPADDTSGALPNLEPEPSIVPGLGSERSLVPGLDSEPAITPGLEPEPAITPGLDLEPGITPEPPATPPATAPMPGTVPMPGTTPGTSAVPTRENSGLLIVWVPYDAKVIINGLLTHSKGSRRQYVSYGLKPGFSYKYEIRAEAVRDGQLVEEVRTVVLTAGVRESVAFGFNPQLNEELASSL